MATYEYIYIEVEDNENCDYMPMQVYEPQAEPRPISARPARRARPSARRLRGDRLEQRGRRHACRGHVRARLRLRPGEGAPHLREDWGVRLKPVGSDEEWDVESPNQFGEPYLILLDDRAIEAGEG